MRDLLTPRIATIRQKAGEKQVDEKFLKDTSKWLEHILKEKYIPRNLWKKCVAVDSHILLGTDTSLFSHKIESIKRSRLSTESYKGGENVDTSGILVRYDTHGYVIMVIDRAQELCVLVKKHGHYTGVDTNSIDGKKQNFWTIMEEVFSEEVWEVDGTRAVLQKLEESLGGAIYEGYLKSSQAKGNEARLNKYFYSVCVTLTSGPVIRIVFTKRLQEKQILARIYTPKSRFEYGTLFDSQDFERQWKKGDRNPRPNNVQTLKK